MSTRTVVIEGPERLEGVLHEGAGIGGAVICHPHPLYGGSMWNGVVDAMEEGFSKAGFTTLRFNFRGVGRSTGRFDEGVGETEDLVAACQFLRGVVSGEAPQALPVEGVLNPKRASEASVSGEAPQALPVEGVLNPNLAGRFVIAGYSFGAWVSSMAPARVAGVTDLFLVAFPFSSYQTGEIRAFSGRIYLVGGSLDDISPLDDLVALHRDLKGEKRLKVIPASHFFEGHAGEISKFILESFREEEG
jgi:alpha/beta superfamily hydrolase